MKKCLLLLLFPLILSNIVAAQDEDRIVNITSTGNGKTLDEAKNTALRSILELAVGTYISTKTEILNNRLLSDQIFSLSAGTIKSYKIEGENIMPDSNWAVTLNGMVSINNLTKLIQSKGISVETNGSEFAFKIKQEILHEKEEAKAIYDMIGKLHEVMQISSDYKLISSEPKSIDEKNQKWEIQLNVKAFANNNMDLCSKFFLQIMKTFTLNPLEIENYKISNKKIYPVILTIGEEKQNFYFRNESTIRLIQNFTNEWFAYLSCFNIIAGQQVENGSTILNSTITDYQRNGTKLDFIKWTGGGYHVELGWAFNFYGEKYFDFSRISKVVTSSYIDDIIATVNFPVLNQNILNLDFIKTYSLSEISSISNITIKPKGITSYFRNGGIVVYEKNGKGLSISLFDIGYKNWLESKISAESLNLLGFTDWHLPSKDEMVYLSKFYKNGFGFGGFHDSRYWSNNPVQDRNNAIPGYYYSIEVSDGKVEDFVSKDSKHDMYSRPVRNFSYIIKNDISKTFSSTSKNDSKSNSPEVAQNTDTLKLIDVKASGRGKTKEESINMALRNAIQQTYGAYYTSKTELFNDKIISDQFSSVSNGNIRSFEITDQTQLPDNTFATTVKAIISIDKLSKFVEAKGISVIVKGGIFSRNIIQQNLNEKGEIESISEMLGLIHEPMQISFDYFIKSGTPKNLNSDNKLWGIPLQITAKSNKNIDFCAKYFLKTLSALSLNNEEVESYGRLNKKVFKVIVKYKGENNVYNLRKRESIVAIQTFLRNWEFYIRLFSVQSGLDEINGKGFGQLDGIINSELKGNENNSISINFLSDGDQAGFFEYDDMKTISQIEKITEYKVKPRGVVSNFKNGGYVIFEKNGHGLVLSPYDLGNVENQGSALNLSINFESNSYKNWRLPNKIEMDLIFNKLFVNKNGGLSSGRYWLSNNLGEWPDVSKPIYYLAKQDDKFFMWYNGSNDDIKVRPVRSF
jgi:hypothetical protein